MRKYLTIYIFTGYCKVGHSPLLLFIVVAMNNRDRYEIIGLCKISHFIKQPCRSVYLKKALEMHQSY